MHRDVKKRRYKNATVIYVWCCECVEPQGASLSARSVSSSGEREKGGGGEREREREREGGRGREKPLPHGELHYARR